ncbi:MAG: hypothetical protein U1E27_03150, partial [Kiritimatiellia bacterium]|nr:hypothetical protein [Kiritimatiellia bacterium]
MSEPLVSSPAIRRCAKNPVLSKKDVPYDSALVFNAGIIKYQSKYVMVFRNDYGATEQDFADYNCGRRKDRPHFRVKLGLAHSDNGIDWTVDPKPCFAIDDPEGE